MLDPSLPWLAVGYRKLNKNNFYRRRYEKDNYRTGFDETSTEDGLRVSTPVAHQRQRIQSATLHRHYDTMHSRGTERPKSAQPLRYCRDDRPRTPSEQTTVSRITPRRRVKSAGHPTRRNIVDLKKSYTLVERLYHDEKLKHVNEHETQTVDQCHYCPVECRPPSSSTNRPTSSTGLVAARLPTHYDRFIYWTRPRTAPGTRKEFLQLPKHNNVRRGNIPHYTNFVKRIDLGVRDRTPSPPRSRPAERPKSASVLSVNSFHEPVVQKSEEELDWQELEIRDEPVAEDEYAQEIVVDEPIHIPTPTPEPTESIEEIEPPEEVGQAWLEPHAPTPTPVASEGPGSPPPEREPTPPPPVVPTQIDIPARVITPPPPKSPSPPPSPKIKKEVRIQEDVETIPLKPKAPKEKKEKKPGPIRRVSPAKKEVPPPAPSPPPPKVIEEPKPVEIVKEVEKPVEKPEVIIPALPEFKEKEIIPEEPKEESPIPEIPEPEPEPIPEPQEEKKKLAEPPRGKAQDLFALDPQAMKELLDMEMRMRRRGPDSHISDNESLLDMPSINDQLDRKPKMQPWLQGRLAFSKKTSRFEIPMDVRVLERMTPVEYLTRYCIISTRRLAFYRRHFNKVDKDNDLKINRKELEAGMRAVHVDSITVEQIDKTVEMLEINNEETYKFNFKIFAALCALSERLLYPQFVTEDTVHIAAHQKEKVEDADFEALDWKLDGCHVNPPVKKILYML